MIAVQPYVFADGCDWQIDIFIDAYRYSRLINPAPVFPTAFDFMALLEDGKLHGPIAGYELDALVGRGLIAFLYLAGGGDHEIFGTCVDCREIDQLRDNLCLSCRMLDLEKEDEDEDINRCPHCGGAL